MWTTINQNTAVDPSPNRNIYKTLPTEGSGMLWKEECKYRKSQSFREFDIGLFLLGMSEDQKSFSILIA